MKRSSFSKTSSRVRIEYMTACREWLSWNPTAYRKPSYDSSCIGLSTSVWRMSSFFFALVPDAKLTSACVAFSSERVSQCLAAPSFRMCMPSTSFVSRATSLKLLCPGALCKWTRVLLWAAWLPNQGDQPLRPPRPCAMSGRRSTGCAPRPKLHSKGRTRRGYHWYKPKEEVSRLVSWCWLPPRSWPLHPARPVSSLKSGCACRWVPRRPASAGAHTSCPCCPGSHSMLCLYLPPVKSFEAEEALFSWTPAGATGLPVLALAIPCKMAHRIALDARPAFFWPAFPRYVPLLLEFEARCSLVLAKLMRSCFISSQSFRGTKLRTVAIFSEVGGKRFNTIALNIAFEVISPASWRSSCVPSALVR